MIYECRKKLPYPISWYDKLSDGSLYSVWHKHIELEIPIDKKQRKYKASNDEARKQIKVKQQESKSKPVKEKPKYEQITLFDYIEEQEKKKKEEPITAEEFARRCLNKGEINIITINIYGESVCRTIVDNNLTVEEYYELLGESTRPGPTIFYNEDDGLYYRKTDGAGFVLMTDEEVQDCHTYNQQIGTITDESLNKGPRLVKKLG